MTVGSALPNQAMNAQTQTQSQSWLHRYVHRPQQVFLRRACFQIHLWAGVLISLYIAAIGISGSILVFKDEFMPRPKLARSQPELQLCSPQSLLLAMDAAAQFHPKSSPVLATCPTGANPFYQINVKKSDERTVTVYVDPSTNAVAGEIDQQASWVGIIDRFHLDLLLRRNGRQWNGVGAAILVALVLSGLVIWWPGPRNWTRAVKVNFRLNWKRISFDLHSAIGIWTVIFTVTWALTGIYFAWESPFERVIAEISRITTARYPEEAIRAATLQAAASPVIGFDLKATLDEAIVQTPGTRLEGFFFGSAEAPLFTVYMAHGQLGDYANTYFVYFNQHNGEHLLTWYRGINRTAGDWMLWLLVPLHFGTSFGMAGKVVWATSGLAFPLLAITGLLMYWNRWLSKRFRESRSAKQRVPRGLS